MAEAPNPAAVCSAARVPPAWPFCGIALSLTTIRDVCAHARRSTVLARIMRDGGTLAYSGGSNPADCPLAPVARAGSQGETAAAPRQVGREDPIGLQVSRPIIIAGVSFDTYFHINFGAHAPLRFRAGDRL